MTAAEPAPGSGATAPLADDVLSGITRRAIMQTAADAGHDVVERRIDGSELYPAGHPAPLLRRRPGYRSRYAPRLTPITEESAQ